MIRVLVVDDSAFMRKAISMMLETDAEIKVVDTARDGMEAVDKVRILRPDVVTMDVEMPRMDGLTALRKIMKDRPTPVLMISSLTKEGAHTTVEALQAGAVDFIPKEMSYVSLEITKIQETLLDKIKTIARTRSSLFRRRSARGIPPPQTAFQAELRFPQAQLIAIGVSTGGPFALQKVIPKMPAELRVPVVVVQHMPPHFTRSLAERLDTMSPLHVVEAQQGMRLERGMVVIAHGGRHLTFRPSTLGMTLSTPDEPSSSLHRPSVDVTFSSACAAYHGRVLTAVMTGMGKDGLQGARQVKRHGGKVVAQDEASCVVYGMPRAVVDDGLADAVVPLDHLARTLVDAVTPQTVTALGNRS